MDFTIFCDKDETLNTSTVPIKNTGTHKIEELKQTLYSLQQQVKLTEADHESQLELIINLEKDNSEDAKFRNEISVRENGISTLKTNQSNEIEEMKKENLEYDNEIEEVLLKINRILSVAEKNPIRDHNLSIAASIEDHNNEMKFKIPELASKCDKIEALIVHKEHFILQQVEEIAQLEEIAAEKTESLQKNSNLIEELKQEILTKTNEIDEYKNKPLPAGSQGNSLFAEIDDKSKFLKQTLEQLKASYYHIQQKCDKILQLKSNLKENYLKQLTACKNEIKRNYDDRNTLIQSSIDELDHLDNKIKQSTLINLERNSLHSRKINNNNKESKKIQKLREELCNEAEEVINLALVLRETKKKLIMFQMGSFEEKFGVKKCFLEIL